MAVSAGDGAPSLFDLYVENTVVLVWPTCKDHTDSLLRKFQVPKLLYIYQYIDRDTVDWSFWKPIPNILETAYSLFVHVLFLPKNYTQVVMKYFLVDTSSCFRPPSNPLWSKLHFIHDKSAYMPSPSMPDKLYVSASPSPLSTFIVYSRPSPH